MKILVLDASQRAALAITRSLGQQSIEVVVADESAKSLSAASRYATSSLAYPSPVSDENEFLDWLESVCHSRGIDYLLPVTEVTTDLVTRYRQRWGSVKVPFASIETIDRISNKAQLAELAEKLGVHVPDSVRLDTQEALISELEARQPPFVYKPARSRINEGGQWHSTEVILVRSEDDKAQLIAQSQELAVPAMVQAFIPGKGAGIFCCYGEDGSKHFFSHQRLREKPPEGGVSVLSQSRLPPPDMCAAAEKLLDAVSWTGVAMVEFRVDPDGKAWLMEVNARFWGSLQLSVDAGMDFPALLLGLPGASAENNPTRLRWFLGDLDRLYIQVKRVRKLGVAVVLRDGLAFMASCFGKSRNEIFRLSDPGPGMYELIRYFGLK